jgi:hypothetical protein
MSGEQQSKALTVRESSRLDPSQRAALEKLDTLLTPGEQVQEFAFQLRIHSLLRRRGVVVATDRRVIFLSRGLLGADLFVGAEDERQHSIVGADSASVRRIYSFAQHQEQAWREKNRIRKMEEMRAQAGGVTISQGMNDGSAAGPSGGPSGADLMGQLKEAKALFDQGALSDTEYETLKAKLLAGPRG